MGFSTQQRDQLRQIHADTLRAFTYKYDKDKWKVEDFWEGEKLLKSAIADGARFTGDCEDFATVCLHRAIAAGYDARLVVCWVETGEGHAICEVASEDDTEAWFFDNRRRTLVNRNGLEGYRFHSVGPWNPKPGDTRLWERAVAD